MVGLDHEYLLSYNTDRDVDSLSPIFSLSTENGTVAPTLDPGHVLVEKTTYIWSRFCQNAELNASCDDYFMSNNFSNIEGIPGLASGIISGRVCVCVCLS